MNKLFACLLAITVWALGAFVYTTPSYAQEEAAPAAAAAEGGEASENPHANQSMFMWVIVNSGLIGAFLLLLSFYFIATVVRLFLDFRPQVVSPPEITSRVSELIQARDFRGIYALVREDDSFLGRTLAAGIAELPNGLPDAREAMDRVGEAETVDMDKRIAILAVLGTLGPMIGLLGTLKGMIASFSVIARGNETMKPAEVAGGISEALLLTLEGVLLAVPAIYFFSLFKNKVSHLSVNAMLQADELLRHVSQAVRAKAPAAAATAPRAPGPA